MKNTTDRRKLKAASKSCSSTDLGWALQQWLDHSSADALSTPRHQSHLPIQRHAPSTAALFLLLLLSVTVLLFLSCSASSCTFLLSLQLNHMFSHRSVFILLAKLFSPPPPPPLPPRLISLYKHCMCVRERERERLSKLRRIIITGLIQLVVPALPAPPPRPFFSSPPPVWSAHLSSWNVLLFI